MTQAKFTKGPWMLEYGEVKHRPSSIRAVEGGVSILRANAFCRVAAKETRANAHLMVAAPELYEALRAADEALAMVAAFESDARYIMGNTNFELFMERRKAIKAALAKARGES